MSEVADMKCINSGFQKGDCFITINFKKTPLILFIIYSSYIRWTFPAYYFIKLIVASIDFRVFHCYHAATTKCTRDVIGEVIKTTK